MKLNKFGTCLLFVIQMPLQLGEAGARGLEMVVALAPCCPYYGRFASYLFQVSPICKCGWRTAKDFGCSQPPCGGLGLMDLLTQHATQLPPLVNPCEQHFLSQANNRTKWLHL